ncbi:uncharacterized protein CIMG_10804 [Coccidioides immitis RS]|uniref:Uncharacterized protein n=1 Tax=Coccidioides immitis (strain RS) TaxID=246410 RepID=A0A0D8JV33_COCIM|nr:uncharacterized protein CIMG_10804 [Coccidioides immitis RS]KJF60123.1 hypothetical protein CIMG_10804 [Coccidioides immitis RS]TPX25509.1 hypothetical protein DIZ76_010964 [Coccidioides immitis]
MKVTQDRTASYLMPKTSFSLIQAFTLDCATFQHRELRRRVRSQEDEVGVGRWDERPFLGRVSRPWVRSGERPELYAVQLADAGDEVLDFRSKNILLPPSVEPETAAISIQFSVQDADVHPAPLKRRAEMGQYECVL